MLKFFRTIRKKLIEQNKVRNYFFYAIGEILLVVIGILIALQVNNWNEERKAKLQNHRFLASLSEELSNNIEILTAYEIRLQKIADDTYRYLEIINGNNIPHDTTIVNLTRDVGPIFKIEISKTAINDIIRSGSLDEIEDSHLKKSIQLIPIQNEDLENRQNTLENLWLSSIGPYYHKNSSLISMFPNIGGYDLPESKYAIDINAFYKNRDFTNILVARLNLLSRIKRLTSDAVEGLTNINNDINKHINK